MRAPRTSVLQGWVNRVSERERRREEKWKERRRKQLAGRGCTGVQLPRRPKLLASGHRVNRERLITIITMTRRSILPRPAAAAAAAFFECFVKCLIAPIIVLGMKEK